MIQSLYLLLDHRHRILLASQEHHNRLLRPPTHIVHPLSLLSTDTLSCTLQDCSDEVGCRQSDPQRHPTTHMGHRRIWITLAQLVVTFFLVRPSTSAPSPRRRASLVCVCAGKHSFTVLWHDPVCRCARGLFVQAPRARGSESEQTAVQFLHLTALLFDPRPPRWLNH